MRCPASRAVLVCLWTSNLVSASGLSNLLLLVLDVCVRVCRQIRAGKGKMRNRRYVLRRGPLVVYSSADDTVSSTLRGVRG